MAKQKKKNHNLMILIIIIGGFLMLTSIGGQKEGKKNAFGCSSSGGGSSQTCSWVSNEPIINSQADAQNLFNTEGILVFFDVLDTDNIFYNLHELEKYCYRGVISESVDPNRQGCIYPVQNEAECLPDPQAPGNEAVYFPEFNDCVVHYIRTRAPVECTRTGEIWDWNNPSEKIKLDVCPNCDWYYTIIKNDLDSQGIQYTEQTINNIRVLSSSVGGANFCSNNQIKVASTIEEVTSYLNKYNIQYQCN